MSGFFAAIVRLVMRVMLFVAALIVVASVLAAGVIMIFIWLLRQLWARLTGRAVSPLIIRVDPRAQWSRFYGAQSRWQEPARTRSQPPGALIEDVTDVVPKEGGPSLPPGQS